MNQRDNSGSLNNNRMKKTPKSPDMYGYLTINGQEYKLSGWWKQGKNNNTFLSLSVQPKTENNGVNYVSQNQYNQLQQPNNQYPQQGPQYHQTPQQSQAYGPPTNQHQPTPPQGINSPNMQAPIGAYNPNEVPQQQDLPF